LWSSQAEDAVSGGSLLTKLLSRAWGLLVLVVDEKFE
jgi:hypothetical protein